MNAEFLHVILALILFFHVDIVLPRGSRTKNFVVYGLRAERMLEL